MRENFKKWPYFEDDDLNCIKDIADSHKINRWGGTHNTAFEKEFAQYIGTEYGIAVMNGTVALELALNALNIGPGDEVITTCRTFIASASSVVMRGARPVVADVDYHSQNVTADTLKPWITDKTKAIIPVHHAGWPCDMDSIMKLADQHNLKVIEDCAQAHGAKYKGKMVGNFGDISAWSFCQDKVMTTLGEGGMVLTNDKDLYDNMWSFKDHGKSYDTVFSKEHPAGFRWLHEDFGTNFRMTEMQAAVGRNILKKLPAQIDIRRKYGMLLNEELSGVKGLIISEPDEDFYHCYYKYYFNIDIDALKLEYTRDRVLQEIADKGVPCMTGTCWNISQELAFKKRGWDIGEAQLPCATKLRETVAMMLVHPTLTEDDILYAIDAVKSVMQNAVR